MSFEQEVADAIVQALSNRPDALQRRTLVTVLSIPATAMGRQFKAALRNELRKRRRATGGKSSTR